MIAGTIGILDDTAEALESRDYGGFATLDVHDAQEYLDGATVQNGRACSLVEGTTEEIGVSGTHIDVETVGTQERVWTDWVADVQEAGFVAAERTAGNDPEFPFDLFEAATGTDVSVARIDPAAFVRQHDDCELWFSGWKRETGEDEPNDVDMGYGRNASETGGNVGVGFETSWNGTTVRGVLYASGYVSVFNSSFGPIQFAAFVRDAVLPIASVPETDDEGEQSTLDDADAREERICSRCDRPTESELDEQGRCVVCQEFVEEEGEA